MVTSGFTVTSNSNHSNSDNNDSNNESQGETPGAAKELVLPLSLSEPLPYKTDFAGTLRGGVKARLWYLSAASPPPPQGMV